ncbi:MAG: acyl-CoA dehydratase activase [Verrucomicrobiota bacterium]
MICAGIDAGSRAIKVVVFDTAQSKILATAIADQGVEQQKLSEKLFQQALRDAGVERDGIPVVATGYGRNAIRFANTTITEITCHAQGVYFLAPAARTILEIGGQDSKSISLEDGGRVRDFAMNDRCAAGSGRFLEVVASRLGVDIAALDALCRASRAPATISSMCVVFAETEIIGLLAEGVSAPDIAAGVQNAIAMRVTTLVGRAIVPPVYFTGGVALQPGMLRALEQALGCPVQLVPQPQFTGALGAAILAGKKGNGLGGGGGNRLPNE